MSHNPYRAIWSLQNSHRREVENVWANFAQAGFALLASAALVGLFRHSFLRFLDRPVETWGEGMEGALLRACVVVVGWMSIDVYGAIVRSPFRSKLDLWPVAADQVVRFELIRVAANRWWLVPLFGLLFYPVALEGAPGLWGFGLLILFGSWCLALSGSALVHLFAVEVAENPRYADLLDLLRGHNPRPQAAFIYAPGMVLLGMGGVLVMACRALKLWHVGEGGIVFPLLLLYGLAALALVPLPVLARSNWFRASVVISEIDARYAALTEREDGLRVYLDWSIRYLPQSWRVYALNDLRHGWRGRRTWISATWVVALLSFVGGWSAQAVAPERAAIVAIGGVWVCAAVAIRLEQDEPAFLRAWLPRGGIRQLGARFAVLASWLQPCVLGGALSTWLRAGVAEALWVVGVGYGAMALAIGAAVMCGRLEKRGLAVYGPVAALAASTLVVVFTGGQA
jgi:hypothetical protein